MDGRASTSNDGTLSIEDLQRTDAAQYSCRAYNTLGSAVRTYNLTIHGNILKSVIWYPASIRQSIRVSDRRSILMRIYSPVDLTGNMNMIEKLFLGGTGTRDLPIISLMHWPLRHQDTLFNSMLKKKKRLQWYHNEIKNNSEIFYLVPATVSRIATNDRMIYVGGTFNFFCLAEGSPTPNVRWFKDGHPIYSGSDDDIGTVRMNSSILTIANISTNASGVFECEAYNGFGESDRRSMSVHVLGALDIWAILKSLLSFNVCKIKN